MWTATTKMQKRFRLSAKSLARPSGRRITSPYRPSYSAWSSNSWRLLQGCGTSPRGPAVPTAFETKATVVGLPHDIRYFPRDPENIKLIEKQFVDSWSRERQYLRARGHAGSLPPASYLAVSG